MKNVTLTLLLLLLALGLFAQEEAETEEASPLSISGSVDAYFRSTSDAPVTSFANRNGFALGMVNLIAAHEANNVGFVGDLVFGPRGEEAVFGSAAPSNIVNQLYAYWNVSDKVTFTLGNFNTFLGYEVISPTGNFNYSTSYMFSYGPFSHTGIKADIDLGGGLSLMLGGFNQTDATESQPIGADYYGGAQLGYDFGTGSAYLNTLFTDGFFQIDLTAGVDLTESLYLGVNATDASDAFTGFAGYLQLATSDALKLGARVEYFKDKTGGILGSTGESSVVDFTVSAAYTVGALTIIPEFRVDSFSADEVDGLSSFMVAAVYAF